MENGSATNGVTSAYAADEFRRGELGVELLSAGQK
jgi:hypothetical protein